VQAFDFETAYVEFTQRYPKGAPLFGGGSGPAQIPFVLDPNQQPHSLAPSYAGSQSGTRYWYVDINGDGLVDLVTYNAGEFGGIPQVRPGDGRGEFACVDVLQPWPCQEPSTQPSRVYGIDVPGPIKPWPFNDETFFHDVTGDGLADIVKYDMATGEVRVWVNQDGHTFACAVPSCVAGKVLNAHAAELGLSGSAAWNIGEHRTTFADMNGDGVDDIVILANPGAYVGVFMKKYVMDVSRGFAPRPGLLTRIHNGYGATTDIQYRSIAELDLAARSDPATAWRTHVPVVDAVVTQITTQDTYHAGGDPAATPIDAPYQFKRVAQYLYQDPAYDRWSRAFLGFRKVVAHYGDDAATTSTTYWYGPCQNNRLNARLPTTPDIPLCQEGSDDDEWKSLAGRVVRVDRGNELIGYFPGERRFTPASKLLWTRMYRYTPGTLFQTPERRVTFAYPSQVDTYLYDDAQPTQPGDVGPGFAADGGDRILEPPHQTNLRKHLRRGQEYDARGTLRKIIENGAIRDEDSGPADQEDATVVTLFSDRDSTSSNDAALVLPCTEDWVCQASFVSLWQPGPSGAPVDKLLRKSWLTYTAAQDVETVADWLDEAALPLDRHHPGGAAATATTAPGQALVRGWHTQLNAAYDAFGNLTKTWGTQSAGGSPAECTLYEFDRVYAQLVEFTHKFVDGCLGQAHGMQTVFDRGFEQVAEVREASGSRSEVRYDPLGRPIEIHLPDPQAPPGAAPVLAETFAYSDRAPLSHVEWRRVVGPGTTTRTVTILNGLGEPVVRFNQGDSSDWVLSRWVETDTAGRTVKIRRPWITTIDPIASAVNGTTFAIPPDNGLVQLQYDGFGRRVSFTETVSGVTQEVLRTAYFPLAMELRDAEQLTAGGVHANAYQRVEFDGRGRRVLSRLRVANPAPDDIVTRVEYAPTGEMVKASRSHAGGVFERTMTYDTLGRLMHNEEPNTGKNWRYVWDDSGRLVGTSDARGCGENFYYDGLNRLVGEDYAPCLASQPAYTPPDLATGAGLEVVYRYDNYEPGQVQPEPGFADDARAALGKLVSVSDRGSDTRLSYDARGRVRRIARQLATPGSVGADSFAQHWFSARMDYDLGDRLTRRTTGADVAELLVGGKSEESYAYSPRGNVASIDSSYGPLITNTSFDEQNAPTRIVFGDARAATLRYVYDPRHRLSLYQLIAPAAGGSPPIGYFDYRFSDYDLVGNPLVIEDVRIAWTVLPAEAAPVAKRTMDYDDLYHVTGVGNLYKTFDGTAPWASPFAAENAAADTRPLPLRTLPKRVAEQQFHYDGLGNVTGSTDDQSAFFDRSLGPNIGHGPASDGPNQLRSANGVNARYDDAGNMVELKVERSGSCPSGVASACAQWFAYDWDEVGQLARGRRWDFAGNTLPAASPIGATPPSWDLSYAYSQGKRVRKTAANAAGAAQHTLEVFDTLRVDDAAFDAAAGDYRATARNMRAYLAGMAHAYWDESGLLPHQPGTSGVTMHLVVGDHLGSSSVVINHATSDLVERATYHPYGAIESDYRPAQWKGFREAYKFTGKEEEIEVGTVYFGARYYQPYLGRFISPDPLTVHGMASNLNPYAYVGGRVSTSIEPAGLAEDCPPGAICLPPDTITVPVPKPETPPPPSPEEPKRDKPADAAPADSGTAPKPPRDVVTFERGDPSAVQKPTRGDLVKTALIKSSQDALLTLVDPTHVNRQLVNDIMTMADDKASRLSKGVAAGSVVLSVIPIAGEAKPAARALVEILTATRTSEELAQAVLALGRSTEQTVAVLETAEGTRLVGAKPPLSLWQWTHTWLLGGEPTRLAGVHAEGTTVEGAWRRGLTPTRGVTTRDICWVCERDLTEGNNPGGIIFELVGDREFIAR
jgi:RHS repeat-associated protein